MVLTSLIDFRSYPLNCVLKTLLLDKSTQRNIVFATKYHENCFEDSAITEEILLSLSSQYALQPRTAKALEQQTERTRKKAEVFTPSWLCAQMNGYCEEQLFGGVNPFFMMDGHAWHTHSEPIKFRKGLTWRQYVNLRWLELTCGEAPFLVSRYDTTTGEPIPIADRIGVLDRKLRVVNENASDEKEWHFWTKKAFQSVHGYEFQGDNLLIARINLLLTYVEHYQAKWGKNPTKDELNTIAIIIAWNIWQMDGLNGTAPFSAQDSEGKGIASLIGTSKNQVPCRVRDWSKLTSFPLNDIKKGNSNVKKFDFVIGNPPYQDETLGENKGYAPPVYNLFLDSAYEISDKVEMIHPARFLFNAGSTPKAWNEKMLSDEHLKIMFYEQDSSKVFSNTDIKGGVVISYRSRNDVYGMISTFTPYPVLNTILQKVKKSGLEGLSDIVFIQNRFNLPALYCDHPECKSSIGSKGKDSRFEKNIFSKIPLFIEEPQQGYIKTLGVYNNKRTFRYISADYVDFVHENLEKYKVVLPVANGSGEFGQALSSPFVEKPLEAYTRSFIGIGAFETENEANAALKYIKSKFARAMLSVLKVTQMNNKDVWQYVPLQDFTSSSDIDWSVSISAIDRQLYRKYGLNEEEITFIETNVKEMV